MKTHARLYASFTTLLGPALLGGLVAAAPAHAGGVSAGTLIENTANASFDDAGGPRNIASNTVTVRVDELLDVTLASLDPGPVTVRPGTAVLTFELTNTGNGPEAFRLTANPAVAGNDFDTTLQSIAIDSNANGTYDAGVDQILAGPETTPVLAADARLTVFVLVAVPQNVADAKRSDVALAAAAVTGSGTAGTVFADAGAGGGDAIVGMTGAQATARGTLASAVASVQLVKSVVLRDPFGGTSAVPGTVATFTIEARVSGSGTVRNLNVTDAIPTGTTYAPGTLKLDGTSLTDAADSDAGTATNASGIAVGLGDIAAGTNRSITFDVTID
ncbi:hypothetical protein ACLBKU_17300 [Erythrobacter sp. NE805]|uniref:hypothetical protein n=1 Tax=Erythrobacter sp. NE805 TaxID=3389875 RepID=UPI00396B4832